MCGRSPPNVGSSAGLAAPRLPQQRPVAARRHQACVRDESPHPGSKRVGGASPLLDSPPLAEKGARDLSLACPLLERVVDLKQSDPTVDAAVRREKGRCEAPAAAELKKAPKRKDLGTGAGDAHQAVLEEDGPTLHKAACLDVQPDVVPAVRQHCMLMAVRVGGNSEPRPKPLRIDLVRVSGADRKREHLKRAGIQVGVPDDRCLGSGDVRSLRESATPIAAGRRPGLRSTSLILWLPCWRACTRRRSQDRGGATPTSHRPGRFPSASHRCGSRASQGGTLLREASRPPPSAAAAKARLATWCAIRMEPGLEFTCINSVDQRPVI